MTTGIPAQPRQPSAAMSVPLLIWLAIQLIALAIAARRVALWADFPKHSDQFAMAVMVVAQIIAISLLFPILLPNAAASIAVTATALPFMALAGILSSTAPAALIAAAAMLCMVITGLSLVVPSARSVVNQSLALGLVAILTLGLPILYYLVADFGQATPAMDWQLLSPITSGLGVLREPSGGRFWISALTVLAIGAAIAASRLFRDRLSTDDHSQSLR